MKMKCCQIYDSASNSFLRPFYVTDQKVAARFFNDMVNDPNDPVGKHPADYTLYYISDWDDKDGLHTTIDHREDMGNGQMYLKSPEFPDQDDLPGI